MDKTEGSERELEHILKGAANYRRIQMLRLLEREPELSLLQVSRHLQMSPKTASEHLRRLTHSGLVSKHSRGRWVHHRLTDRGRAVAAFLRTLEPPF